MQNTDELGRVMARIRALFNKTVENGCTFEEALAASAVADRLMEKYNISLSSLDIQPSSIRRETFDRSREFNRSPADYCHKGISALCDVKMYCAVRLERTLFGDTKKVRLLAIVGLPQDIEYAQWLYEMLDETIMREGKRYRDQHPKYSLKIVNDFEFSMGARINTRLTEMARTKNLQTSDGKSLVVVKGDAVSKYMDEHGIKLSSSGLRNVNSNAAAAGQDAGNRVILQRPLHHNSHTQLGT